MNPDREFWNQQQQALQHALARPEEHPEAIALFLSQHAMVHSAQVSQAGLWSFEDEVWQGLTEADARRIPRNNDHSIAWITWHLARIEDVTMNLLVAGSAPVLDREGWLERMKVTVRDTGNAMDAEGLAHLSAAVDIPALRAYRQAVGRRTREIAVRLTPQELKQDVQPSRLAWIMEAGAVTESTRGLLDFWGRHTLAGLLLMPATRHNFVHLNEALRIKPKR